MHTHTCTVVHALVRIHSVIVNWLNCCGMKRMLAADRGQDLVNSGIWTWLHSEGEQSQLFFNTTVSFAICLTHHTHTHSHTHTHTYIHTHKCTYMYMYTHGHGDKIVVVAISSQNNPQRQEPLVIN